MKYVRSIMLAASAAALASTASGASAATAAATPATGRAQIVKGLTLQALANLDFGQIVVWGSGTATIDTSGNIVCTTGALACATTGSAASFKVTGSNGWVVTVNTPDATLNNQTDSTAAPLTLVMNGHAPTSVTLPNSGTNGTNFNVGGSIAIPASVKDGVYQGDLNVTVNY
jgi:hypothetical protein